MDDLVVWLRQQLDEDERGAQAVQEAGGPWYSVHILEVNWHIGRVDAEHIALHDPARVLREVEAKRLILDVLEEQQRRVEQNNQKYVEAMRSPRGGPADDLLPGIKTHGWTLGGRVEALEEVIKLLALPYSERPGYREEEWKP
jgi:hypothetical protein